MFNRIISRFILNIVPKDIIKKRIKVILTDNVFKIIIRRPKDTSLFLTQPPERL